MTPCAPPLHRTSVAYGRVGQGTGRCAGLLLDGNHGDARTRGTLYGMSGVSIAKVLGGDEVQGIANNTLPVANRHQIQQIRCTS